jgi:aminoglycoside/choline kinase family phosphotransferase
MSSLDTSRAMAKNPDRELEITAFLERTGWADATRLALAGDASFRRYERLVDGAHKVVLMDAPPPHEDVRPFVHVSTLLQRVGLSVPVILDSDEEKGFLLLEDLGDDSFTQILVNTPKDEKKLYMNAIDALIHMQHNVPETSLPAYDTAVYLREVSLFSDWFLPQIYDRKTAQAMKEEYLALWQELLSSTPLLQRVIVHRDYHADNLFWLPERRHEQLVGMLDYQDALCGDPLYDVVSLLEDARRDVHPEVAAIAFDHFLKGTDIPKDKAKQRFSLLGAQRNLKIIGIFTRLAVRDGKSHYLSFLPRVWTHLLEDLKHPSLEPLATFIAARIPETARGVLTIDMTVDALS